MIQSLEIANFRCFKAVQLHGLSTFNVIVGRNGAGKTAFLESLLLLAGVGPELVLKIRCTRGLGDNSSISTGASFFELLWRDMFFDCDETSPIELKAIGTDEHSRWLVVSHGPPEGAALPFGEHSVEDYIRKRTVTFVTEQRTATC